MRIITILAAFLISLSPAFAEHHEDPDKEVITAAVFDYFHGQGEASEERLFRAFAADDATMVGVMKNDDGVEQIRAWRDMNEVLKSWAANANPPGGDRDGEILHMNIVDGRIATVLFRSTDRFYDALTLAKVNGEWKIVAKAFVRQ